MSNIIGIKANLALDKSKLTSDIKTIQKQIAGQENLFKIGIDAGTMAQLATLKQELKEIIALSGKGIKIDINTKVVHEAKQTVDGLQNTLDMLKKRLAETSAKLAELGAGNVQAGTKSQMKLLSEDMHNYKLRIEETEEQLMSFNEKRKKSDADALEASNDLEEATERAQKVTRKYWQDTDKEISRVLVNTDSLGNSMSTTWNKDKDGDWSKGTIQESDNIDTLNKKFDSLKENIANTKLEYEKLQSSMSATQKNEAAKQGRLMNIAMSKTNSDVLGAGEFDEATKQAKQYENVQKAIAKSTTEAAKFKKEINSIKFSNPEEAAKLQRELEKLSNMTDLDKVALQVSQMGKALDDVNSANKLTTSLEKVKTQFKNINKEADKLAKSQNDMRYSGSGNDAGIASARADVDAQRASIDGAGNQASLEMIANYRTAVETYSQLIGLKQTEVQLSDSVASKQKTLNKELFKMKTLVANGLMTQGQFDELDKAIAMLAKTPDTAGLKTAATGIENKMIDIKNAASDAYARISNSGTPAHGLKRISDAMAKVGLYFSSWRLTSEVFQELKRGIGVIGEIDNQIVQVGIDMDITSRQASKLTREAMRIASETGIAIDQIVRVAGVYSNATEDMESVLAKVKPSAILAGVAGADATQITDMFQGVVNQYKLTGDDMEEISYQISDAIIGVSKNLANNFDDSVKEISETMLDAGAVMEELGYTYQETMAMAGAVMEVSRQSGSEMGGAFRMIGARIGGAKNTGEDVDAEEISNAAKAYKELGIQIVDTDNNFKPMKETLSELSEIWDTLTDVERSYIAEASAGNRRRNTFMIMMNTMAKQTDLATIAMDSQGDTLEANAKYMESTGAKAQNFKNAMDEMWMSTLNADVTKFFIELGTTVVKLITQIGGLNVVIALALAAIVNKTIDFKGIVTVIDDIGDSSIKSAGKMVVLKSSANGTSVALNTTALSAGLLQAALSFGLSFAIMGAIGLLSKFIDELDETAVEAREAAEAIKDLYETKNNNVKDVSELLKRQEELEGMQGAGSPEEQVARNEELAQIYADIAKILPTATTEYDEYNTALATNNDLTREMLNLEKQGSQSDAQDWLNKKGLGSVEALNAKNAEMEELNKKEAEYQALINSGKKTEKVQTFDYVSKKMVETTIDNEAELAKIQEQKLANSKEVAEVNNMIVATGNKELETAKLVDLSIKTQKKSTEELNKVASVDKYKPLLKSAKEYNDEIKKSTDRYADLQGMIESVDKKGASVDQSTIEHALEYAPQLIQYLGDETKLRAELVKLQATEGENIMSLYGMKILALSEEEKFAFKTYDSKTLADVDFYNNTIKNNQSLVNEFNKMYGIDLKNYNSLAEAKNIVDTRYVGAAIANYNQLILKSKAYQKGNTHEQFKISPSGEITENPNYYKTSSATNSLNALSYTPTYFNSVGRASQSAGGSSADKSDQSYTSETVDYNTYIALIEEHQKQLDILDRKIAKVTTSISNLNDIGSESALQQSLVKQNELYKLQIDRVNFLKMAQNSLLSQQNSLGATMSSKYGVSMSALTEEDKNYYLDKLYPEITSTNENLINQRNDARETFSQMFDDWMRLAEEGISLNDSLIDSESTLIQLTKDKYETEFTLMDKRLERYKKNNDELANELSMLNENSSYNEREHLMAQSVRSLNTYRQQLESVISDLTNQQSVLGQGTLEWQLINDQLVGYEDTLQSTNQSVLSMQENLKNLRMEEYNSSMSVIDKMVATLRKQYEEAKKAELDSLKAGLDAELKTKTDEIKILQDRLDALNDTTSDKEAELQALRAEKAMWEDDDTIEAKRNLFELEKLIKDAELELEKDNIQAQIDNIDDEVTAIEDANDDKVESVNTYYEALLQEQALYNEAMLMFTSMSQDEILNYLLSYDEKYKGMGSILGAAFAEGLLTEVKKGVDGFTSLSDGLMGSELITWLTQLPDTYNYANASAPPNMTYSALGDSTSTMNSGVDTVAMNAMIETLRSYAMKDGLMNLLTGGVNILDLATSGMDLSNLFANANMNTQIGTANITMPVNFYTNGQIDVNESINRLEDMLKGVMVGSGVMLSSIR